MAVLKAKHGKGEELRNALLLLINPTRSESGCLYYILFEDKNDSDTFYMWEAFEDEEAFKFHTQTSHFQGFAARTDELLNGPIQLIELAHVL